MSRPNTRLLACLAAAAGLGFAPSAHACRIQVPRTSELSKIKTVVMATVDAANRLENSGWNYWHVSATGRAEIRGAANSQQYEFNVTLSSEGCGQAPLPEPGETWVIYLESSARGRVLHAYPLEFVRRYDRRLATVQALPRAAAGTTGPR